MPEYEYEFIISRRLDTPDYRWRFTNGDTGVLSEQEFRAVSAAIRGAITAADNPDSVKLRLTRDLADAVAQRAAGAHPATYLLGRLNEPGISWDDDWNLTAWDYDPADPQKHIVVTEADLAPADSEPADPLAGMPTHPRIERNGPDDAPWWVYIPPRGPQDFDTDGWSILGPYGGTYWTTFDEAVDFFRRVREDVATPTAATGSVKTWTYSQVNPGGADVTHGLTFTGTDDEWAEHLADLTYQGIEPFNAKITAPVAALGTNYPATPEGFAAAQAEADRMADEENRRIATANLPNWVYPLFAKCAVCGEGLQFDIDPRGTPGENGDWGANGDYGCTGDDEGSDGHTPINITYGEAPELTLDQVIDEATAMGLLDDEPATDPVRLDSDDIDAVRAARDEWRRRAEQAEHDLDHIEAIQENERVSVGRPHRPEGNPGLVAANGRWITVGELREYLAHFPADMGVTGYTRETDNWVNIISASNPFDTDESSVILDTRDDFDTRQF